MADCYVLLNENPVPLDNFMQLESLALLNKDCSYLPNASYSKDIQYMCRGNQ